MKKVSQIHKIENSFKLNDTVQAECVLYGDKIRGFYDWSWYSEFDKMSRSYIITHDGKAVKCFFDTVVSCRIVLTEKYNPL